MSAEQTHAAPIKVEQESEYDSDTTFEGFSDVESEHNDEEVEPKDEADEENMEHDGGEADGDEMVNDHAEEEETHTSGEEDFTRSDSDPTDSDPSDSPSDDGVNWTPGLHINRNLPRPHQGRRCSKNHGNWANFNEFSINHSTGNLYASCDAHRP